MARWGRFGWGSLLVALATLLSSGAAGAVVAAPGSLDPTFGGGTGRVTLDFNTATSTVQDRVHDMVLAPDGKVLIAGSTGSQALVARFGRRGVLDRTFGSGGVRKISLAGAAPSSATSLALGGDGTVVVGGTALARLRADGSLDLRFGRAGVVALPAGATVVDLLLQPSGRVVAAIRPLSGSTYVRRFLPSGRPDATFGAGGRFVADGIGALARQSDGALVVAASDTVANTLTATRLAADGAPDPTFGRGGRAEVSFPAWAMRGPVGVAIGPAGGIVLAGPVNSFSLVALARLTARGRLDRSFDHDGKLVDLLAGAGFGWMSVGAVVVQPDGRIVLAGALLGEHGEADGWALQRYDPHGTHDPTFGGDGLVVTPFGGDDTVSAVALQPDGKIVAAGPDCAAWEPYNCVDFNITVARFIG